MGNNPVSRFDPDGGWSKLGAAWRWTGSFIRGEKPSAIYKKDGEYGFNFTPKNVETDAGGIATVYAGSSFGPNRKMQEVTNSLPQTAFLNPSTGNYDYAKASGRVDPSYVEFEAILTAYSGGQYLLARRGLLTVSERMAQIRALGMAGEEAVGISGAKTAIKVGGRTRIPDKLTDVALIEVKNVKSLSFTKQLRDFHTHALDNNLDFILYTRPDTKLSGPLKEAIKNGTIIHRLIP